VLRAQRNHPDVRFGASRSLYHELLPTILGQRITAGEAVRQWRLLVRRLGRPAPGPFGLTLPPDPDDLAGRPTWWFHPLGIEVKRADALRTAARHARRLWTWADEPDPGRRLALLPGVGQWTIGSVLSVSHGDPDAVAVGDFHLKNIVAHAFTGRARGTDEQMLELLQPYAGQRGRVIRLLLLDGHRAPAFGPRQRVLPLNRW
jgi:3-methyladenine DNA glycosylase/8-oxoguanine DNA glycosylase